MDQNQVFLIGRVAAKPILKSYNRQSDGAEGTRCFFRLLTTRRMDRGLERNRQRTNAIPIVAWGAQAQRHAQFLDVGTEVCVLGELISEGVRQADGTYQNYWHVQAVDVQYGQRSLKNASAADLQRRIEMLNQRLTEVNTQPATPAAQPATAAAPAAQAVPTGDNPFDTAPAPA